MRLPPKASQKESPSTNSEVHSFPVCLVKVRLETAVVIRHEWTALIKALSLQKTLPTHQCQPVLYRGLDLKVKSNLTLQNNTMKVKTMKIHT